MNETHLLNARAYEFFQAVRLTELSSGCDSRTRLGGDGDPSHEPLRFRALPSMGFAAEQVAGLDAKPPAGGRAAPGPPEMSVTFFGMTGPNGALPAHYTSLLINRLRGRDTALREFLDLFNHRLVSLFYRAWKKHRPPVGFEQAAAEGGPEDPFGEIASAIVGRSPQSLRERGRVPDRLRQFYAGLFSKQARCPVELGRLLSAYFGMPVKVHEFQQQWLTLDEANRSALASDSAQDTDDNCLLGQTVFLGERISDSQSKFRVVLGPMDADDFQKVLPSGGLLAALWEVVRAYVGAEYDFDVQAVLQPSEAPGMVLGGPAEGGSRLGWNTWLHSGTIDRPVDDAVFPSPAA